MSRRSASISSRTAKSCPCSARATASEIPAESFLKPTRVIRLISSGILHSATIPYSPFSIPHFNKELRRLSISDWTKIRHIYQRISISGHIWPIGRIWPLCFTDGFRWAHCYTFSLFLQRRTGARKLETSMIFFIFLGIKPRYLRLLYRKQLSTFNRDDVTCTKNRKITWWWRFYTGLARTEPTSR